MNTIYSPGEYFHRWRTATGVEVDFVVEHGRRLLPIEVKSTTRPGYDDAKGVEAFLAEYPEAKVGLVIHAGDEVRRLGERVAAVPWWVLAGGGGPAARQSRSGAKLTTRPVEASALSGSPQPLEDPPPSLQIETHPL